MITNYFSKVTVRVIFIIMKNYKSLPNCY